MLEVLRCMLVLTTSHRLRHLIRLRSAHFGGCCHVQGQYFSELECSLSSDMAQMSHFCRQWRLKPSASKTISSVFHLHNTSATRELSVYLDGQRLRQVPPNLSWGESRLYAVLQRTLDKDCRQAEEPKQLVDEASRFHLGRQRQHSAVICSGALLFSSSVGAGAPGGTG